jgi:hypothetical protein
MKHRLRTFVLMAVLLLLPVIASSHPNVSLPVRVLSRISPGLGGGIGEFLAHVKALPDGDTTIDTSSSSGISITCKRGR